MVADAPCFVATPLNNLANLYHDQGKFAEAEALYRRALPIWQQAHGKEDPTMAYALTNLAILLTKQGKDAEALYQRISHIWQQAQGPEHPRMAHALANANVSRNSSLTYLVVSIEKYTQLTHAHPSVYDYLTNL